MKVTYDYKSKNLRSCISNKTFPFVNTNVKVNWEQASVLFNVVNAIMSIFVGVYKKESLLHNDASKIFVPFVILNRISTRKPD